MDWHHPGRSMEESSTGVFFEPYQPDSIKNIDIAQCRQAIFDRWGKEDFKRSVIQDLEQRRDMHCMHTGKPICE